jgi:LysM repeat protein
VVAVPARTWRPYLLPAAFLAAVTLGVVGIRAALHHSTTPTRPHVVHHAHTKSVYIVRPGDRLGTVATKTGVPVARLRRLNPKLQPTALFIGERIRLR